MSDTYRYLSFIKDSWRQRKLSVFCFVFLFVERFLYFGLKNMFSVCF